MKVGRAAQVEDRVGAGHEGEGGDQHLIAGLDAGQKQGQVQRGRARAEGQGVARADLARELGFEGVDVGTEGRNPVGGEGVLEERCFLAVHVRGERKMRWVIVCIQKSTPERSFALTLIEGATPSTRRPSSLPCLLHALAKAESGLHSRPENIEPKSLPSPSDAPQ